jgi:hypothetical protein
MTHTQCTSSSMARLLSGSNTSPTTNTKAADRQVEARGSNARSCVETSRRATTDRQESTRPAPWRIVAAPGLLRYYDAGRQRGRRVTIRRLWASQRSAKTGPTPIGTA